VVTAESTDAGKTWRLHPTAMETDPAFPALTRIAVLAGAGTSTLWAIFEAEAGLGHRPAQVAVSQDGGRTWRAIRNARVNSEVLGQNGPTLLVVKSEAEVWLISLRHYQVPPSQDLTLARTTNGGRTWSTQSSFSHQFDGCGDCAVLSILPVTSSPQTDCFGVIAGSRDGTGNQRPARYCSQDKGRTWALQQSTLPSLPDRTPAQIASLAYANTERGWLTLENEATASGSFDHRLIERRLFFAPPTAAHVGSRSGLAPNKDGRRWPGQFAFIARRQVTRLTLVLSSSLLLCLLAYDYCYETMTIT
jgi:hypothetical protein